MSVRFSPDFSTIDSSWEAPVESVGSQVTTKPSFQRSRPVLDRSRIAPKGNPGAGRSAPNMDGDDVDNMKEDEDMAEDMEIDPDMIIAFNELPPPGVTRSATTDTNALPPVPAPGEPRFFNIPLAKSSTSIPPPGFTHARGTSNTPRPPKRSIATKGHDSTSLVSPLPPPVSLIPPGVVHVAPEPHSPSMRSWILVGISGIATGVAIATVILLVSSRDRDATPPPVTPVSVAAAALPEAPAPTVPLQTMVTAPSKQPAVKPAPRPRSRVATKLDAKPVPLPGKPPATNLDAKPVAAPATKPALAVTRERAGNSSTKAGAPAPKQLTKIDPNAVAQTKKKPVALTAPAAPTLKTGTTADGKLATRKVKHPAAGDTRATTRTARPAPKAAAKPGTLAKSKAVASVDPKPATKKKKPATR